MFKIKNGLFRLSKLPLLFLVAVIFATSLTFGQNIFYHLLGLSQGTTVAFQSPSQSLNESTGTWGDWPSSLNSWTKRRRILLDGFGTSLADFPVMIKLDATRISYASTQSAGQDLRFTDSAGNLLSFEIETYNTAGTSTLWVKVPSLAASPSQTSIWMYYGNAGAANGQAATAVWDSNFSGVWHLNSNSTDSTSNGKNGTDSSVTYASGLASNAVSINGTTGNRITLPTGMTSSNVFTFTAFFKTSTSGVILGHTETAYPGATYQFDPLMYVGLDGMLYGGNYHPGQLWTTSYVADNNWHQVVITGNSTIQKIYVDGQYVTSTSGAALNMAALTNTYIGMGEWTSWPNAGTGWSSFNGQIDEVSIATAARSDDWVKASYSSVMDALATFQSEETQSLGQATIGVTLSAAQGSSVSVPYSITGTATNGSDYVLSTGSVVFNPGVTSVNLTPRILRDQSAEISETLIVTLGAPPTGVSLGSPNPHTLTILDETNVAPVANTDSYTITNLTVPMLLNVLANDTDANNDPLIITSFTAAARGTVLRQGNKLSYLPSEDFAATDSFTYTISDGRGGTATATVNLTLAIPFTWTGATNTSWSTGTNWLGGVAPGVSNTAYFNNQCSTNCNPAIAANISIGGLRINSSYIGTIAQPAGLTITIGNTGWVQRGGTFTGGNSAITIGVQATAPGTPKGSGLNVSGGTFTATSNTLTVNQGDWTLAAGMTFNHNNGTVKFGCGYDLWCIIQAGGKTHNHVRFEGYRSNFSGYYSSLTISGNLSLGGLLAGDNRIQDLDINVSGNVTAINQGYFGGRVRLVGNAAGQTVTGAAGIYIPSLEIAAGTNPVTLVGDLGINGGWNGSYVYTSSGTFTAPTTLRLMNTSTLTPGPVSYNNVTISGNGATVNLGGGTFTITGTLTLDEASYSNTPINDGTINLSGNYVASSQGYVGTAVVNLIGPTNTTWSQVGAAQWIAGLTTVNKSAISNTVTLSSAITLSSANQALTVTRGILNMAGYNLTVAGALTVGPNGKILCNGGTLTAGSTSISGEVSCGISVGITWTGLAGDGKWTTAGNWTNNNVPGANDLALFGSICSTISGGSCNATIDASISVRGINLMTGYTGTLTQGATSTIALGSAGYTQAAGTFTGSSASITTGSFGLAAGNFNLSGGTFNATSGTLTNWYNWTISGGTFNHNSGTVVFEGSNIGSTLSTTAVNYNNVTFRGAGTGHDLSGTTMTVLGVLTLGSNYNGSDAVGNGTINAKGNVVFDQYGKQSNFYSPANLTLKINGSSNQTITSSIGAWAPKLEIASTGGTVTFTGDFIFSADYIWTSGTVNATAASFIFDGKNQSWTTKFDSSNYNNIKFNGSGSTYNLSSSTLNVTGTLTLNNLYSSSGNLNSGTINVKGNLAATNYGYLGNAVIKVNGSTNQTISGVSGAWIPGLEIASTGGVVSLSGTVTVRGNYTYTSGVVNAGTSTLHFYAFFTTHALNPGTILYNNVKIGGDGSTYTLTGSLNVQGTFEIAREGHYKPTLNTGTVLAYGNIYFSGSQNHHSDYYTLNGTHLIRVMGSANQSVSSASGWTGQGWFGGHFEVAKTGGTLTFTGTQDWLFSKNFTHTSGSVDFGTSQANFYSNNNSLTVTPGSINFNNVWIEIYPTTTVTVSGTWQISGQLTLNGYGGTAATLINGGSINLSGNLLSRYAGFGGTTQLNLIGSTNTDFTYGSQVIGSTIVVNKTGGASVRWLSDGYMTSGQNLTVTSGTLDLNGYDLQTDATLTVASGASVVCNNGNLSVTTITNSGTISCPGFTGWTHNWTGAGGNALWSNAANWSGGVVPGATHVAGFNSNLCGANCNPTIDTTVNVLGLQMKNNYSGTITANAGVAITVGARGWKQDAGTFNGSSGTIITNGHLRVWGGSYRASSGSTQVVGGGITLRAGSTFTHNSGTFIHDTNATGWGHYRILTLGGKSFNNFSLIGAETTEITDSANVAGTLTVDKMSYNGALTNGTLNVSGNVNITKCECGNTYTTATLLNFTGTAAQTLTMTANSPNLPRMAINKAGGSLTWSGDFAVNSIQHTAGTVIVPANHTVTIKSNNAWGGDVSMSPGTIPFQNLTFASTGNIITTGSWSIAKDLTINHSTFFARFTGGTFKVSGNMSINSLEGPGDTAVLFEGSANQSLTTASANARPGGTWTINKPAGTVNLASNLSLGNTGQDLMITAGTSNMAGYNLSVNDNITNSGTLRRGTNPTCGTVSSATYTGTAAICP